MLHFLTIFGTMVGFVLGMCLLIAFVFFQVLRIASWTERHVKTEAFQIIIILGTILLELCFLFSLLIYFGA